MIREKISNRNYPILEKLRNGSLGVIPTFESDKYFFEKRGDVFTKNWKYYQPKFKSEINIITKPFQKASEKAVIKLVALWEDIVMNEISDFSVSGCFVVGDFVYMIDYEVKRGGDTNELGFYAFNKDGIPLMCYIDSSRHNIPQNGWVSTCFETGTNPDEIQKVIFSHMIRAIVYNMFKSYAEVETKTVGANKRYKDINCKYTNDTNSDITFLDSTWFTNLVKSEGFNVRGHFRLQPKKKDGEWTKELIWISEFEKTGYNRKAKKLSYEVQ